MRPWSVHISKVCFFYRFSGPVPTPRLCTDDWREEDDKKYAVYGEAWQLAICDAHTFGRGGCATAGDPWRMRLKVVSSAGAFRSRRQSFSVSFCRKPVFIKPDCSAPGPVWGLCPHAPIVKIFVHREIR